MMSERDVFLLMQTGERTLVHYKCTRLHSHRSIGCTGKHVSTNAKLHVRKRFQSPLSLITCICIITAATEVSFQLPEWALSSWLLCWVPSFAVLSSALGEVVLHRTSPSCKEPRERKGQQVRDCNNLRTIYVQEILSMSVNWETLNIM